MTFIIAAVLGGFAILVAAIAGLLVQRRRCARPKIVFVARRIKRAF